MWEAYGLENEELLWASTALRAGVAGNQSGTCGALSSAAVCLGLQHACPLDDKARAEEAREAAYDKARGIADAFVEEFGAAACIDLTGVDFSDEAARQKAREEGMAEEKCHNYVKFVVGKLYDLEGE